MALTDDAGRPPGRLGPRDIWAVFEELSSGLEPAEAKQLQRRLGYLWGQRALISLAELFKREFGQSFTEARLSSVVEALSDVCEQADLGRVALDLEDASSGFVHVWQYGCPLAQTETLSRFAAYFLEGFHETVLRRLANRQLGVRWLVTDRRNRVLRFLTGTQSRLTQWDWTLGSANATATATATNPTALMFGGTKETA